MTDKLFETDKRFKVYSEEDLRALTRGKGLTEVPVEERPHGIFMVPCADNRLAGGGVAQYAKYDSVYKNKPFSRCVEGPVEVFSDWVEVHTASLLHSFLFFAEETGADTFALDAHSECKKIGVKVALYEQAAMGIRALHNLRRRGELESRLILTATKIQPGRWKTIILFDTFYHMPVLAGTEEAEKAERLGLLV